MLNGDEVVHKKGRCQIALEEKGDRWWTVEYSKRYRNVTKAFWELHGSYTTVEYTGAVVDNNEVARNVYVNRYRN